MSVGLGTDTSADGGDLCAKPNNTQVRMGACVGKTEEYQQRRRIYHPEDEIAHRRSDEIELYVESEERAARCVMRCSSDDTVSEVKQRLRDMFSVSELSVYLRADPHTTGRQSAGTLLLSHYTLADHALGNGDRLIVKCQDEVRLCVGIFCVTSP